MKQEPQPSDLVRSPGGVLYRVVSTTTNLIFVAKFEIRPERAAQGTLMPESCANLGHRGCMNDGMPLAPAVADKTKPAEERGARAETACESKENREEARD
jgi:hypothetical protein